MAESCDTNILFYALNAESAEHSAALSYLKTKRGDPSFLLCELTLLELYVLVRNPLLNRRPAGSREAVETIQEFCERAAWRVVDYPGGLMSQVWELAAGADVARRRISDIRLAVTLRHHGVHRFATRNARDFRGLGFTEVFDPIGAL